MKLIRDHQTLSCGLLVIGGGGAGLRSAIAAKLKNADVLLASKTRVGHATNTYISKAIIAATGWGTTSDDKSLHATDTIKGGRFLSDQSMVAQMTERVPSEIAFLRDSGVRFGTKDGSILVVRTPGHSHPRHVYGEKSIGSDLIRPLRNLAQKVRVRFADRVFVTRLLSDNGRITGATGLNRDGMFVTIQANVVVLATGGFARIYLNNDNAAGITGDGQALAYDLGVPLKDLEFVQFYPTATGTRGNRILLYERILVQEGVVMRNKNGEDIIEKHGISDLMSLTRDRLTQLIMQEIMEDEPENQCVIMDLEALSQDKFIRFKRFLPPSSSKGQKSFRVSPTAHFCMGGVVTDQNGETCVDGLLAVGEIAAGIHGANRLGGNALAEIFAMGSWVGEKAAAIAVEIGESDHSRGAIEEEKQRLDDLFSPKGLHPRALIDQLKELMWNKVGIIRHEKGLKEALKSLQEPWNSASVECPADLIRLLEFQNMLLLGTMVCRAALERKESRGSHYRADYPEEDNNRWLKNILLQKKDAGTKIETKSVSVEFVSPES